MRSARSSPRQLSSSASTLDSTRRHSLAESSEYRVMKSRLRAGIKATRHPPAAASPTTRPARSKHVHRSGGIDTAAASTSSGIVPVMCRGVRARLHRKSPAARASAARAPAARSDEKPLAFDVAAAGVITFATTPAGNDQQTLRVRRRRQPPLAARDRARQAERRRVARRNIEKRDTNPRERCEGRCPPPGVLGARGLGCRRQDERRLRAPAPSPASCSARAS